MAAARNRPNVKRPLLALVAGVLVTILISWTAMFIPYGHHGYGPPVLHGLGVAQSTPYDQGGSGKTWQIDKGRNAWHHVVSYRWLQLSGMSMSMSVADFEARKLDLETLPPHLRPESLDSLIMQSWYREVGWPFKAMTCSIHWQTQVSNADITYRVEGGVQLPRDREFTPRALPLTPLWPGFVFNVLFWGVLWFGVSWITYTSRARWRVARGRCRRCAYPRAGLPPQSRCPECGSAPLRS